MGNLTFGWPGRVGIGWDRHRLAAGRRLVVGGVELESDRGAVGHSDGDALLHAIIDAMLGAAGLEDIGWLFPDNDPALAGADSRDLLARTVGLLASAGWRVAQVDSIVVLERPKLGERKPDMRRAIANVLGLDADAVNVKAKTAEGVDAAGRGEAIEAQAVVMLQPTERLGQVIV